MEFRILGPLEILDGERRLPLGGTKRRAVASLLLLEANHVVSSERLIDGIWEDDPPAAALGSLHNHVLRLRRELGDRLQTRAPGYLLRVEHGELDLDRFRRLVDEARAREPDEASSLLRQALALWRGAPLADLAGEPVAAHATHLDELRLEALERRIEADLALGRHTELVPELEALVAEHPFREHLRTQLLLSLYRSSRQAEALEAYAATRATLVGELGTEPGPELQALHRAILRQDPALEGPAATAAPPRPPDRVEEARKTVTVVLGDLAAETPGDPEARRERLRQVHADAAATLEAHGGTVGRTADDRLLGIFGVPVAHDDDALRAVRAAVELRAAGVIARAAVSTGVVITGDPGRGQALVSGPPLEEADRLRASAEALDVLIGERAWRLVRHAVVARRRGQAHAVERVLGDAEGVVRRFESDLVGREHELAEIVAAFGRLTRDNRARLVSVFGTPGVGKTRLAQEAVATLAESATCIVGRTSAYGDAPTYAPLRDALAPLAGGSVAAWAVRVLDGEPDGDQLAARIAAAMGEGPSAGPVEETAWAVRRLLERLARNRPVVVVLEDLHWATPAFLDLVEHVAELGRAPVLLLALARPELLDTRPGWGGGSLGSSSILLDPLAPEHAAVLLDRLALETPLAADRRAAILGAAAGNPLFLEQLLASALEGDDAIVPDSIHALLAARLDRLGPDERRVVQAAAVCGQTFPAAVVQSLVEVDVGPALLTLARRDFVDPEAPDPLGGEAWAFRHALVRDEAYESIPKRNRSRLHEQIAAIVAEHAAERGIDADELIGYHLESAYRATADVDPEAPELARLAADAARHLAAAGGRAHGEDDSATSVALLRRAAALLPPGAPERLAFTPQLAHVLGVVDEREAGLQLLDEAERAAPPDDEPTRARLRVARHDLRLWGGEPEDPMRMLEDARWAIRVLEAAGDDEMLAWAHVVAYHASHRRSAATAPKQLDVDELRRAVAHARAAGARATEGLATSWLCVVMRRGGWTVDTAEREILEILEDPPTLNARAAALGALGTLRAMEGAFDAGRALVAENHTLLEELGLARGAAADLIALADVEIMAGELGAAERLLRDALGRLDAFGDRFSAVNAAWRLALVVLRDGRDDEAEMLIERAGDLDAGEFVYVWRCVLGATVAARRGETERALELLDASDRSLASLGETGMHADVLLQGAEASAALGRTADAAARLRRAADIARRLGYLVAERRAEEKLAELEA